MNYYEMRWNERKEFLKSSSIIGTIAALLFTMWVAISSGFSSIAEVFEAVLTFVVLALLFTAIIVVTRMMRNHGGAGKGFAINMVNGLWIAAINAFTGSGIGIVIGLFLMFIFFWLFLIVAAIYAIYFPISTIYFYVMYKKQIGSKGASTT